MHLLLPERLEAIRHLVLIYWDMVVDQGLGKAQEPGLVVVEVDRGQLEGVPLAERREQGQLPGLYRLVAREVLLIPPEFEAMNQVVVEERDQQGQ